MSEATGLKFERGLGQTRGGGAEVADVKVNDKDLILHFELKNQARCNIKGAMAQATEDAPTKVPVVVTKDTRSDTLVTMRFEDWVKYCLPVFVS